MNSAIVAQRPTATLAQPPEGFVRRHPVLSYYLLTFAISWGGFLLVGSPGLLSGTDCQTDPLFPVAILALLAGPAAAGLILTGRISGRAGYRDLLARLGRWRVAARWYGVALLTAPLLMTASLAALSLFSAEFLPGFVTASDRVTPLLLGLVFGPLGAPVEELGWTGFVIPRALRRYGVLPTGLLVGSRGPRGSSCRVPGPAAPPPGRSRQPCSWRWASLAVTCSHTGC